MENEDVSRFFETQLKTLKTCVLGSTKKAVIVSNHSSSEFPPSSGINALHDIFDVTIEIAGVQKVWQIVFDIENPKFFTDIIFQQDNEDFSPDISRFESVKDWNIYESSSLLNLITELYESYLNHQRNILEKYYQVKDDFKELLNTVDCAKNCEVQIKKNGFEHTYKDAIAIQISLDADFDSLPHSICKEIKNDVWCCLSISFEPPNFSSVTTSLNCSSSLASFFGDPKNLKIPSYKPSLSTYVLTIERLVQKSVSLVVNSYEKRKKLMFCLLSHFKSCVLEYDTKLFLEASFLLDVEEFHFILFINLPDEYPSKPPNVSLQSIYNHRNDDILLREPVKDFDFQPEDDVDIQVQNILEGISKALVVLKSNLLQS